MKKNPILCIKDYVTHTKYSVLQAIFFGKCLFEYKINFEKKKTEKFGSNFKNVGESFCVAIKKASHII